MGKHLRTAAIILILLGLFPVFNSTAILRAEDKEEGKEPAKPEEPAGQGEPEEPDELSEGENLDFYGRRGIKKAEVDAAVDKACTYLKGLQQADGSIPAPANAHCKNYPMGNTALSLFALLKGGVPRTDPVIRQGMQYCRDFWSASSDRPTLQPGQDPSTVKARRTYSVCCLILALEAYYAPRPPKTKKEKEKSMTAPYEERVKKNFARFANPTDKKLMKELVAWLLEKQEANVWRYPGPAANSKPPEDASNTQYVALALNAARRCNVPVPADCWMRMAQWFIKEQDKDGPEVKSFRVPGADTSVANLKREAARMMKAIKKELKEEAKRNRNKKKKDKDAEESEPMDSGPKTHVVDEEKIFGPETHEMKARGWPYVTKTAQGEPAIFVTTTGSMTTSGVAALMICKAALERYGRWKGSFKKQGDQAIRDGCAWLSHYFSVDGNPCRATQYHHYFLYGLERAGVLSLCMQLGEHDWYAEGAKMFLKTQAGDGSWGSSDTGVGGTANTCFGVLFLKRATTPIIELPKDTFTGGGLWGGKEEEENVARPGK
ncbi:MAG: prenyltransferase/squalene oxidase repeat-containing protein [Planctomycetota bacterium]|jgi:hypothetical protein